MIQYPQIITLEQLKEIIDNERELPEGWDNPKEKLQPGGLRGTEASTHNSTEVPRVSGSGSASSGPGVFDGAM
jgi:hypothetical protein